MSSVLRPTMMRCVVRCAVNAESAMSTSRPVPQMRLGGHARRLHRRFSVCRAADEEGEAAGPELPPDMEEQAVETEPAPEEAEKMSEFEAAVAEARAAVKEGTFDAEAFLDKATSLYKAVEEEKASAELVAEAKDSQLQGIKDQFMRLQADFENFRKRQEVEKGQLSEKNTAKVIESFIPLVDTFELARQQIKCETEAENKINQSYQGLYRQMVDIFRGLGVEAVPTVGHQFDPEVHEAVMQEEAADVTDGEVLKEFRKGFTMKGRLLRPAMVVVCTNDAMPYVPPAAEEEGKDEGEADASAEREAEGDEKEAKEEEEAKQ